MKENSILTVSNTGTTVTICMAAKLVEALGGGKHFRVDLDPASRKVTITRDEDGYSWWLDRHGGASFTRPSHYFPKWPLHGRVGFDTVSRSGENAVTVVMPEVLPQSRKKSDPVATAEPPPASKLPSSANMLLRTKSRDFLFCVPEDELLELAISMAHKGQAIQN